MSRTRILILSLAVLCFLAVVFISSYSLLTGSFPGNDKALSNHYSLTGSYIGGPFILIDHNGNTVTERSFNEKYKLIYFGFTWCPSVCPTELQKMVTVLTLLGKRQTRQIQPLFITVDPERDTPDVMGDYVKHFHPQLVGLTGSRAQIDKVLSQYKVYAVRADESDYAGYTMDHSSYIYLMDARNRPVALYKMEDSAEDIARDLRQRI